MVLMGGPSAEHEVSLHTGEQILMSLDKGHYEAIPIVITKKGDWILPSTERGRFGSKARKIVSQAHALTALSAHADMVFIALHGQFGEDGIIQSLLDGFKIPYTGSGMLASGLGMDKVRSSRIFRDAGMNVPAFYAFSAKEAARMDKKQVTEIVRELGMPLVVKPIDQGSSIGVSIVPTAQDMLAAITAARKYSRYIMIQKFIKGREITCGVIDATEKGKRTIISLPPIEIVPHYGAFYDYKSKYKNAGSDHLIPPPDVSPEIIKTIQDTARNAHAIIGCSGMSRSDFILDENNKLHILEINTIPGMTSTSLLPQAAAHIGITFPKLLDYIILSAIKKEK